MTFAADSVVSLSVGVDDLKVNTSLSFKFVASNTINIINDRLKGF
jgi:hypothetical protein